MVEAVGADVTTRAVGDRVFGITGGGAQAEYVAVPAVHCALVPDRPRPRRDGRRPRGLHHRRTTRWSRRRGSAAGEWVLVHAIGSGVGTDGAATRARVRRARRRAPRARADKLERCRALGLDAGIEPTRTADGALDVDALGVVDRRSDRRRRARHARPVGGDYVIADVNAAAPKGRIVCIGTIAGGRATLPIMAILGKRLTIIGTVLRGRDVAEKAAATDAFVRDVVPLLADGRIAPIVEATLPLDQAEDAYDLLESDTTFGKVILDCR